MSSLTSSSKGKNGDAEEKVYLSAGTKSLSRQEGMGFRDTFSILAGWKRETINTDVGRHVDLVWGDVRVPSNSFSFSP